MSEVTDSLTIIVSEETGDISLAYRGTLTQGVTGEYLKERLITLQNKVIKETGEINQEEKHAGPFSRKGKEKN